MQKKAEKCAQVSLTDRVYLDIRGRLERNEWLPGDRLPSENELSQQYDISRISVRAALQKLVSFGMLEVKTGGGYYVRAFAMSEIAENVSGMLRNHIAYEDFNYFRALLEERSLDLLRHKPLKPGDLRVLSDCCAAMEQATKKPDRDAFAREDYRFHLQICAMSGNGMFVYAYELIGPLFLEYLSQHYLMEPQLPDDLPADENGYERAVRCHLRIVEALRIGDVDLAKRVITDFTHMPQM